MLDQRSRSPVEGSTARERLAGAIERVTFHNADSGFCVLRIKVRGQRDLVTVTGHAAAIGASEYVEASGVWLNDRDHGLQFKAERIEATVPTTLQGLEKYLGTTSDGCEADYRGPAWTTVGRFGDDMKVQFCGASDKANPSNGLCDEYRLGEIDRFDEVRAACEKIEADHPGYSSLISLDNFAQACYTSNYAVRDLGLDETDGVDLTMLPPECFEGREHRGYLSTKAEFAIRARNFARLGAGKDFADACGFDLTLDAEIFEQWRGFQDDPLSLLDQPLSVLVVPDGPVDQKLAAFPNGYFGTDLGPALNAAVVRHFHRFHSYDLIGIGASYIGLWRDAHPDGEALDAIVTDFRKLYTITDGDWHHLQSGVTAAIGGRSHLWLRYTE